MAAILKGSLVGTKAFDSSMPVTLCFALTNSGKADRYVLKWFTPLEGLDSDCLSVVRNGKTKIAYDGPLIKRGTPAPDDYVLLPAGQTITADINLNESYAVSGPARYQVSLKILSLESISVPAKRRGISKKLLAKKPPVRQRLVGGKIKFKVARGAGRILTRGQAARRIATALAKSQKKTVLVGADRSTAAPLPPKIIGGTLAQKAQLKKAHLDGFKLCTAALQGLADNERYREWFGRHSSRRFSRVKSSYARIVERMNSVTYVYALNGNHCRSSALGYTFANSATIWFCSGFWKAAARGTNSKAGTIIHEHSHCDARTLDLSYGVERARALAIRSPNRAVMNADNYEYFAEG